MKIFSIFLDWDWLFTFKRFYKDLWTFCWRGGVMEVIALEGQLDDVEENEGIELEYIGFLSFIFLSHIPSSYPSPNFLRSSSNFHLFNRKVDYSRMTSSHQKNSKDSADRQKKYSKITHSEAIPTLTLT